MVRNIRLESFEVAGSEPEHLVFTPTEYEEKRLEAYESGYRAGWDDAMATVEAEESRQRAAVAENLRQLSFTYDQARSAILAGLEPLFRDMTGRVLPAIAREALPEIVLEELLHHVSGAVGAPVRVLAEEHTLARIRDLVEGQISFSLDYVAEPALGAAQACLQFGEAEFQVDLDGAIERIAAAIRSYFTASKEKVHNE